MISQEEIFLLIADYWDGVQSFIYNIMEEVPQENMEIVQALYYSEAALDWQLTNISESNFEYRKMGEPLPFELTGLTLGGGGDYEIDAIDLLNLNLEIMDAISIQASELAVDSNQAVYIQVVDLTWVADPVEGSEILATVLYGLSPKVLPSPCGFGFRYSGIRGACNSVKTQTNAHELIDAYTSPLSGCGTWRDKLSCNLSTTVIVNTGKSMLNGASGCGFTFFSGSVNTCITPTMQGGIKGIQQHHDDAQNAWNNYCVSISNINSKLRTVFYDGDINALNISFSAIYFTGKCRANGTGPTDPAISRPCAFWNSSGNKNYLPYPC